MKRLKLLLLLLLVISCSKKKVGVYRGNNVSIEGSDNTALRWAARSYELVEVLGPGDEITALKTPKNRSKWLSENEKPNRFLLRRLQCQSPDGGEYVLHTSLLDKTIGKHEIQELYLTRWDIEVGIGEIKTVMAINILRSQTPGMALKELTVWLAGYHLIRKMIYASIKNLPFSPKKISLINSIRLIRLFFLTKREDYTIDGLQVVEQLSQLIRRQVVQKRKPNRSYARKTQQGRYKKYR